MEKLQGYKTMKLYGIGNALLYYREQNHLSQTQVCEGICPEMTLSRIETGEREFDSMISETLLERVGKTANRFEFVLNNEDYALYELREKIKQTVNDGNVEMAKECLNKYKNIMPESAVLHEQFVLYYEAIIMEKEGEEKQTILKLLYNAINLTRPDYKEKTSRTVLYSNIEINIIYHLFTYEDYTEEMLSPVFRFVEQMYDVEEKRDILIPFYLFLVRRYEREENFYEMKRISEQAIVLLQKGRNYLHLTEFHFYGVKAMYGLYKCAQDWKAEKLEMVERCNEIYYMSMIIEDDEMMRQVKQFCEEKFGCQITM